MIEFQTNADDVIAKLRERRRNVHESLEKAQIEWNEELRQKLYESSSGPLKTSYLDTIRPGLYSKTRIAIPEFDGLINRQEGLFRKLWRVHTASTVGNITTVIENRATNEKGVEYAKFMLGTVKMKVRPVIQRAISKTIPLFQLLQRAKRNAEK